MKQVEKHLKLLLMVLLTGLFLYSCSPATVKDEPVDEHEKEMLEAKEPDLDDTLLTGAETIVKDTPEMPEEVDEDREMIQGFRIKVSSENTMEDANDIKNQIEKALEEPVYIEFLVDKYLVYVGDCQNKAEANELKKELMDLGYEGIYAVPKKVYKKEEVLEVAEEEEEELEPITSEQQMTMGYRVQVFATINLDKAENVKTELKRSIKDKIYVVNSGAYHKVQVGDYIDRSAAEQMRDRLIYELGQSGSFVVETSVNRTTQKPITTTNSTSDDCCYFVQIGAFTQRVGAEEFLTLAKHYNFNNASIYKIDGLFKVLVGGYATRSEAERSREKLISASIDFQGAWIVVR